MLKSILKGTAVVLVLGVAVSAQAEDGISIANGKVKMNSLLQFWFMNDTSLGHQVNAAGKSNDAKLDMLMRRAEVNFSGALSDTTRWEVGLDFARPMNAQSNGGTPNNVLNDFVISQTLVMPELTLDVGQFKTPTVAESLDADGQLMFPERSMVARTWGEARQPGARLAYTAKMWKLQGMISNGANTVGNNIANNGQNQLDVDRNNTTADSHPNNKDLTFRFDIKPMEMVSAGAFTYFPSYNWGQGGAFGGNVRVMPMEDLVIRGEYVRGWVRGNGGDNLPHNGYVIDGGYQYGDFQPVARYEIQQQCVTAAGANSLASGDCVTAAATTFGLNYYMMKHNSKLQFAYTILGKNASGSNVPAGSIGGGSYNSATGEYAPQAGTGGTVATLAFQIAI